MKRVLLAVTALSLLVIYYETIARFILDFIGLEPRRVCANCGDKTYGDYVEIEVVHVEDYYSYNPQFYQQHSNGEVIWLCVRCQTFCGYKNLAA